ncbi:M56 family metallopeptidase [Paenibacillus sp. FSL R7-0312]|uniref:M56 family metallopeptidase n=1 Tax=Paenibacillus sp. FSL R7-0312 TaxID=2921682 RepID=UPI0030FCDBA3
MDQLLEHLMKMTITGSYCIVIVILMRLMLRRVPKIYSYALWSIVLFRLICPFSFESAVSLIPPEAQQISLKLTAYQAAAGASLPEPQPAQSLQLPEAGYTATVSLQPENAVSQSAASAQPADSTASGNPWAQTALYIWLTGIGVMLLHSLIATVRLKRRLESAKLLSGNIYETRWISTPFVSGMLRPRIYLPPGLRDQERAYIIKHEQVHIRRFDHIIKPLACVVLCIHWFNPLVWLAFFLMSEDMEKSCDESVIRQLGSGIKQDYSLSLLALSTGRRFTNGSPLAFGESGTKGRIRNILHYRKPAFWVVLLCIAGIAAISVGLLGNPRQQVEMTERDYAEQYIEANIASYQRAVPDLTFEDSTITTFERIGEFDHLLDTRVQLWAMEYRLKPDDADKLMQLGNINIEDGMLTEDGSMGKPILVFSYQDSIPEYLGEIRSGENDMSRPAGQETVLRKFFEEKGMLPHETFSGNHILVKFIMTTGETSQLLLSQPVKQGEQGIWTVERWMDTRGNEYYETPETEETLAAYYASLQAGADAGTEQAWLDPLQVAVQYIRTELGQPVSRDNLVVDYEATAADFAITPVSSFLGYVTGLAMDSDTLNLDQVEWLTLEDSERFAALGITEEDLPGGFYILNKYTINDLYTVTAETEYKLIDRVNPGSLQSVSKAEFIAYSEQFTGFAPPCMITVSNNTVNTVTEVYVP